MKSKNGLIGILVVVVIAIGAIFLINESNEGPLEKAAEDFGDAADDVGDEIEDAGN
ncbi:hypothetical protein [Hyphococcus lacteus]|uniref:Uncharacterized protein n=1 Tax=Hyphococcus lacteus TaxID=3143536 RepID=A0ABV3Z3L8_9PROT